MPKRVWLPRQSDKGWPGSHRSSGIGIVWTQSASRLRFDGWYDSIVGIEGDSMTLREFFDMLGITEKDCAKAWKRKEGGGA